MSNLLRFVEENLIFKPEQCYDTEDGNGDDKNSSKNATNVPLISPQSTLDDKLFKPSSASTLFDEPKMLLVKENIQDQIFQNDSTPIVVTPNKNNTNPFLQDDCNNLFCDQINNDINPQKFMQLWNENLQVQLQITAILNILLNKVMKDSTQKINDNLTNDESALNIITSALLHANKQMSTFINPINENTANTNGNVTSSVTNYTAINNDMNIGCPKEHPIPTSINQQPLTTTLYNRNHNLNTYIDTFQNTDTQNAVRNPNTMNPNFFMPTNNNVDSVNQFLADQQTPTNHIPPGFQECSDKFKFDSQNCFANDINTDLMSAKNPINSKTPLKETNPFKLSLAGKLQILEPHEEKCSCSNDLLPVSNKNNESVTDRDLINFEDNSKTKYTNGNISDITLFDQYFEKYNQYFFSECSNNTNNVKNSSFALNAKSPDHNWNVNDVSNAMSKIIIGEQSAQYNVHKKEMEKHCFPPSKKSLNNHDLQCIENPYKQKPIHTIDIVNFDHPLCKQDNDFVVSEEISNSKTTNGNVIFLPNYNLSNCKSCTYLSTNNSEHSLLTSNANVDEGYLTRSSTSHTLYSSSPIVKFNEAQSSQISATKYSSELSDTSAELWSKMPKDIGQLKSSSKIYFASENSEEKIPHHEDCQENEKQNLAIDVSNFQSNVDNIGIKSPYSKESELKTDGENIYVPKHLSSNYKVVFQIVELPKRIMHIFHYQGEGWLLVDEFVEAFTELGTSLCMVNLLCAFNIHVQFEEIDKTKNSIEFIKTNSMLSKATCDIINGTNKLQLMPLKSALKVLYTLKVISQTDINDILLYEKFVNDSTVHEIWSITDAYRGFKYRIENGRC